MLEDVIAAFERKDYKTADWILKQLVKQEPQNPWVQFYVGRLHEITNKLEAAETTYRQLLQNTTNPKIVVQARQGLKRLEELAKQQRQAALNQATAAPNSSQEGLLILESISTEAKQIAAQKFARIMELDPYTARLQLPSRGWRLYRLGPVGQLGFYGQQLQQADIPCFWASLADIQKINVFQVHYFSSAVPQAGVVCENAQRQLGSLTFAWSEVRQRVEGLLPIFEEVFDTDVRRNFQHKTKVLDYVQFCDLHLPGRNTILRLCDRHYQFEQGLAIAQKNEDIQNQRSPLQTTTRKKWNDLLHFLNEQLPEKPVWSEFTAFAETGLDKIEILVNFPSHINLSPQEETTWDKAFELYSGAVFLRRNPIS